jgi:hypothetical protein
MLSRRNLLRIRNRCQALPGKSPAVLINTAVSAHIARHAWARDGGTAMQWLARLILACIMTAVMVFTVTLIVTFINLGLRPDFLMRWAEAYIIAWPIAAGTAFVVMPTSRRLTDVIMRRIGG